MSDAVNHPPHYTSHASGVEAIEICEHASFCVGNAIKYLFRADHKGATVEDLKKSAWYLRRACQNAHTLELWPHNSLVDRVLAYESEGSVLGDVLRALLRGGADFHRAVLEALNKVEKEIANRTEKSL